MAGEYATVKVSRRTLEQLERLKRSLGARSLDEVLQRLIREYRARLLEEVVGIDEGLVARFEEDDRLDSRI